VKEGDDEDSQINTAADVREIVHQQSSSWWLEVVYEVALKRLGLS
jgi:hypothetical protein